MTPEEYLKIYQAQKQKLLHDYPNLKELSPSEFELLEKASQFANGNDESFDIYSLNDARNLLDKLFNMFGKISEEEKKKELLQLIQALKFVIDTEEDDDETDIKKKEGKTEKDKSEKTTKEKPNSSKIVVYPDPVKQKVSDIAEWAKKKFLQSTSARRDERKRERTRSAVDCSSEFDGLSREELVEYYHPSKFYFLDADQRQQLYQATVNEYSRANGVQTCPVKMAGMPATEKSTYYGLYRPQDKEIYLNSNLFNNFDDLRTERNAYFPYHILSTLVHETTHHKQFQNLENGANDEKTRLIRRSMMNNQSTMSFSEYLSEADELDARNSALEYFKEAAQNADQHQNYLASFYNAEKRREQKNPKKPVSKELKEFFPEIYDNTKLASTIEKNSLMRSHQRNMGEIILGRHLELQLTKAKRYIPK